ncbi:hypothetical protein H8356DRAFT_1433753 [Neocallimastix lanati (nom. inval.)]|nr:hypothetical protein H8356DRAFT_1433753 [Neocallimastix sp. JGI-2020a]
MFPNSQIPRGDRRPKKDGRKDKFSKINIDQMLLNGMPLPIGEPKKTSVIHTKFFNDFEDDFDDETI